MIARAVLRSLTIEQLGEMYRTADDATAAVLLAEAARRDRADRARQAREAERAAWQEAAHAQYLAADAVCRGNLVNRAGRRAGVSDWSLWSGPEYRAMKYATEELREFWYANPRVTVEAYRRQLRTSRRAQREDLDAMSERARVDAVYELTRNGQPAGLCRETTVTAGSWPRAAWWAITADGKATLYPDPGAALLALLNG